MLPPFGRQTPKRVRLAAAGTKRSRLQTPRCSDGDWAAVIPGGWGEGRGPNNRHEGEARTATTKRQRTPLPPEALPRSARA